MRKVSFITLGCKINQYESEQLAKELSSYGYDIIPPDGESDIYVINTCTVTSTADQKSRQMIRRARRMNRDAFVIVTGCYATTDYEEIKNMKEVDVVIKNEAKGTISSIIRKRFPIEEGNTSPSLPHLHTRYFIKIEDGCDRMCTFCKIPFARGTRVRSRDILSIKEELLEAVDKGFKEVVLCGINIGRYGIDLEDTSLTKLIDEISEIEGLERIRISSIDINDIDEELMDTIISNEKVCHHLHLSLQSGDDTILKKMGRRYSREDVISIVGKLRAIDPLFSFSVDVIVGFPGETEEMFLNTVTLIENILPTRVHIFRYSPRAGTIASRWKDNVPAPEKRKRMEYLKEVRDRLVREYAERHIGRVEEVLVEKNVDGSAVGLNRYYVPVTIRSSLPRNTIVRCKIVGLDDDRNNLRGCVEK